MSRIRYCVTTRGLWYKCNAGWGSIGGSGMKTCNDEPMEKNCRNIVESTDPLICPTCGTVLGIIGDKEE